MTAGEFARLRDRVRALEARIVALEASEGEASRLRAAIQAALRDSAEYPQLRMPDRQYDRLRGSLLARPACDV